jgi:hypothetical protein
MPRTASFLKDVIYTGAFYKASERRHFEITLSHLKRWAAECAGVPIQDSHSPGAKRVGEVASFFIEPAQVGTEQVAMLRARCAFTPGGAQVAARADVSVYVDDGGRIAHVALCTDPVIPGLGSFELTRLAASHGAASGPNRLDRAVTRYNEEFDAQHGGCR